MYLSIYLSIYQSIYQSNLIKSNQIKSNLIYIYIYLSIYLYGPVLRLSTPPSPPHGLGPQVPPPLSFYLQAIGSISDVQLRIC